jgi:hypothetical protein
LAPEIEQISDLATELLCDFRQSSDRRGIDATLDQADEFGRVASFLRKLFLRETSSLSQSRDFGTKVLFDHAV